MLQDLNSSDFIRIYSHFGKKKEAYYQLRDYYTLFYFRFLHNRHGQDEHFWTHSIGSPSKNTWAGLSYEMLCKDHTRQIKQKIGISAVLTEESSWSIKGNSDESGIQNDSSIDQKESGVQIDLLIDRKDHVIDICEIKHSENEYTIDKDCALSLNAKREVFRRNTGTKKTIQIILISTYGIKQNKYSSLISGEVTLDDLFMS